MAIAGNVMHFKSEFAFFQSVCEPAVSSQVLLCQSCQILLICQLVDTHSTVNPLLTYRFLLNVRLIQCKACY